MPSNNGNGHGNNHMVHNGRQRISGLPDYMALNQIKSMVQNAFTMDRQALLQQLSDPRRNIEDECGYPGEGAWINPWLYQRLFEREPIAAQVVACWSKESWQATPRVEETKNNKTDTPFEEGWDGLGMQMKSGKSWHAQEQGSAVWEAAVRLDEMSGIGQYGVMLLGFDDGKDFRLPAYDLEMPDSPGLGTDAQYFQQGGGMSSEMTGGNVPHNGNGTPHNGTNANPRISSDGSGSAMIGYGSLLPGPKRPKSAKQPQLLYVKVFPETLAQVTQWESNRNNPRFCQPVMYLIRFNDPSVQSTGVGMTMASVMVHWTRVVHASDTFHQSTSNEVLSPPRMRPCLNRILDLRKLYGADAEGFWRNCAMKLFFETHPQLGGDVEMDLDYMRSAMEEMGNGLQNWMATAGFSAKSIPPALSDPTAHVLCQIEAICIQLRIPKRVFMGSERGELASSQDDAAWNDRLKLRQQAYITPRLIVPLVDRLIQVGCLPPPKSKDGYSITWPDLSSLTSSERAQVFLTRAQAYSAVVSGGLEQLFPPKDVMTKLDSMTDEEADQVLEDATKAQEEALTDHADLSDAAAEHDLQKTPPAGFEAKPPPPPPGMGMPGGPPMAPVKMGAGQSLVHPQTGAPIAQGPPVPPKPPGAQAKANAIKPAGGKIAGNMEVDNANPEGHNQYTDFASASEAADKSSEGVKPSSPKEVHAAAASLHEHAARISREKQAEANADPFRDPDKPSQLARLYKETAEKHERSAAWHRGHEANPVADTSVDDSSAKVLKDKTDEVLKADRANGTKSKYKGPAGRAMAEREAKKLLGNAEWADEDSVDNANPEGINQWTKGGFHKVEHEGFSQRDRKVAARATVKEAHRSLTEAGYVKGEPQDMSTAATKMGRSQAYGGASDAKETTYVHPEGKVAVLTERHPKYGTSSVTVHHSPTSNEQNLGWADEDFEVAAILNEWNPDLHPRAPDGKFGEGGGEHGDHGTKDGKKEHGAHGHEGGHAHELEHAGHQAHEAHEAHHVGHALTTGHHLGDVAAIAASKVLGHVTKGAAAAMKATPGLKAAGHAVSAIHEGLGKAAESAISGMAARYGHATASAILGLGSVAAGSLLHGAGLAIPKKALLGAMPLLIVAEGGRALGLVGKDSKLEKGLQKVGGWIHGIKEGLKSLGSKITQGGLKAARGAGRLVGKFAESRAKLIAGNALLTFNDERVTLDPEALQAAWDDLMAEMSMEHAKLLTEHQDALDGLNDEGPPEGGLDALMEAILHHKVSGEATPDDVDQVANELGLTAAEQAQLAREVGDDQG